MKTPAQNKALGRSRDHRMMACGCLLFNDGRKHLCQTHAASDTKTEFQVGNMDGGIWFMRCTADTLMGARALRRDGRDRIKKVTKTTEFVT